MTNCPNCGAVITGPQCEYCDTRFDIDPVLYTPKKNMDKMDRLIKERLGLENELLSRKTRALADAAALKDLYTSALNAMRQYSSTY